MDFMTIVWHLLFTFRKRFSRWTISIYRFYDIIWHLTFSFRKADYKNCMRWSVEFLKPEVVSYTKTFGLPVGESLWVFPQFELWKFSDLCAKSLFSKTWWWPYVQNCFYFVSEILILIILSLGSKNTFFFLNIVVLYFKIKRNFRWFCLFSQVCQPYFKSNFILELKLKLPSDIVKIT